MAVRGAFVLSFLAGLVVYFGLKRSLWEAGLVTVAGFFGLGGLKPTLLTLKTLPRDWRYIKLLAKMFKAVQSHRANGETVPSIFSKCVARHPKKTAIIFEDQTWTFEDIDRYSNRIANMFHSMGFNKGNKVAIYMMNRPEYTCILLGLSKIGVVVPLINYNLTQQSLLHCVDVADIKGLIYEESLETSVSWLHQRLSESVQKMTFCIGGGKGSVGRHLDTEMKEFPDTTAPPLTGVGLEDTLCYIFTSGTTGLPKCIACRHFKFVVVSIAYGLMCELDDDDIVYICLPLYFTIGMGAAMGQMAFLGRTVVLSKEFSVQKFWKECMKHKCTAVIYVGELLRFLLSAPPDPTIATAHHLRVAIGNGLRRDIRIELQRRFRLPVIKESYGTSEGNCFLADIEGKPGTIGFMPKALSFLSPRCLIKADPTTGEVVRNSKGYCTRVSVGEPGLLVNKIQNNNLFSRFDGFVNNPAETNKKILRNVFKDGDNYYNTGDMMVMDDEGYLYFSDRAGDTFRWKGENVSTTETENMISSVLDLAIVIVFGVDIPNTDDRAGMAVIQKSKEEVDMSQLANDFSSLLPSYAVPLFLRFVESVDLTGTFKFQKTRYRKEGYNPGATGGDPVYVKDKGSMSYVPLDEEKYQEIINGIIKF